MPKGHFPRGLKATHEINGVKMSKLKHDRIRAFEAMLPQIAALNAAGKSQADAAEALGTTVCTLRKWIENTGTQWTNLKVRGPYKKRA